MYYAECLYNKVKGIQQREVMPEFAWPHSTVDLTGFDPFPEIGEVYDPNTNTFGPDTSTPDKKRYTLASFLDALTDNELDAILDLVNGETGTANQKRQMRRVWEYWRASNAIDFNRTKNQQVLTFLVSAFPAAWTDARKNELIG